MINTSIYKVGIQEANRISNENLKMTEIGSLKYFLWGSEKSEQSIVIKFGRVFEKMLQKEIQDSKQFNLGTNGIQRIRGLNKKKDIDLLFCDTQRKIVYYRELKANIDLDTEKLPATVDKIKQIEKHLQKEYASYSINYGVLCMTVYSKIQLSERLIKKVNTYENAGVPVDFAADIFSTLGVFINESEWRSFGLQLGKILRS